MFQEWDEHQNTDLVNEDGLRAKVKAVDGETLAMCKAACLNERLQSNPCIGFVFWGTKCFLKSAQDATRFKNMGSKFSGKLIAGNK